VTCTPSPDVVCYAHTTPHHGAIGLAIVALLLLLCVGGPLIGLSLAARGSR
jgi:hypothetical protein